MFEFNNKKYEFKEITAENERKAKIQKGIVYNKLIKDGIPTEAKMYDTLKKAGQWSKEDEKEVSDITNKLAILNIELNKLMEEKDDNKLDKEKIMEVSGKMIEIRTELMEKVKQRYEPLMYTCEHLSQEIYYDYIIYDTLYYDNTKVYKEFKDFLSDKDTNKKFTDKLLEEFFNDKWKIDIINNPENQARIRIGIYKEDNSLNVEGAIKYYRETLGGGDKKDGEHNDRTTLPGKPSPGKEQELSGTVGESSQGVAEKTN